MFSQLQQGGTIYILDKENGLALHIGEITSTSNAAPKDGLTPQLALGMNVSMVKDIRAKADGQDYEFKGVGMNESSKDYGNAVICDSPEVALSVANNIGMQSQMRLEKHDYDERVVKDAEQVRRMLNPSYAKEQERDEELKTLKERFDGFEELLKNIEVSLRSSSK